jgi:hypothetical protein
MFLQRSWSWVSDEWLVSKTASRLFGAAAILILATTPLQFGLEKSPSSPWTTWVLAIFGATGALSIFFLWSGMWRHWTQCNTSRRAVKRGWFFVLLFGLWWGAVVYYLVAYLRRAEKIEPAPRPLRSKGLVTKALGLMLLIGWIGLISVGALVFAFPKSVGPFLRPIADYFVLIPTSLLLGTAVYAVMRLYRAGMNRV